MKKFLFLLLLPVHIFAQRAIVISSMQRPQGPTITVSTGSISGFTSVAGTLGSPQTYTLGWVAWNSNNITVTAPSNYVVSQDNSTYGSSTTVTASGSTGSITIYVALASGNSAGSYSGTVNNAATGASTVGVAVSGTTSSPSPSLSVTPSTLSGFSSTAGSVGASQNYALSGSNLTANVTVTPPTGFSLSTDNATWLSSLTLTPSSGSISQTIYAALAAANTAGSYSGNVTNASTGATTKNVAVSGSTSGSSVIPDSLMYVFDTTNIITATLKQNITGNCAARVLSGTTTGTAITYTTVSTSSSNWGPLTGSCIYPNDGVTNATIPAGFSGATGAMVESFFTSNLYNTSNAQFISGGWNTSLTYDIEISGATSYSVNTQGTFNVKGASLQTSQIIGNQQNNTSSKVNWTAVAPDASGNFTFYFGNTSSSSSYAFLSYIKITKH